MKIAMFLLFAVSVVLMSRTEVTAGEVSYVLEGQVEYTLDEETQTAVVSSYHADQDATCTEIVIAAKITHNKKEYTVTSIGAEAFRGATYLEKVQIPETVTEIGKGAFASCYSLKEINLPSGLKKISRESLHNCSSLETIKIPNTVTIIEPAAFYQCTKLKKLVIPNGVTVLGECSFGVCTGLEEVVIPKSVKTIEDAVFVDCDSLKQIVIPEGVERFPASVLINCDNLKIIICPDSVKGSFLIEEYADVLRISYIINPDGTVSVTVENMPEGMTEIELPSDIGGRKITSIAGPEGLEMSVSCATHHAKTYTKNADSHQYTCVLCKKDVKEAHNYAGGVKACECGYVPFAIKTQPAGMSVSYGKGANISVKAKATFGKEKIAYQWQENGKTIAGAKSSVYEISKRKPVGSYTYTCKIVSGSYSQVTKAVTVTVKAPAKGNKYKDDKNIATYKVLKARTDGKGTVEYVKPAKKKKAAVVIPATVKIGGVTYKVTGIAKNAFRKNRNIKRLTIEVNVEKIGAQAFYRCENLKTIVIKTTRLKEKKIGARAFEDIRLNATVKLPKKKFKAYKALLKKKGMGTKVNFRKI